MARRNKKQVKIKAMGDQKLVAEIEKLQNQIALSHQIATRSFVISHQHFDLS